MELYTQPVINAEMYQELMERANTEKGHTDGKRLNRSSSHRTWSRNSAPSVPSTT